jgi:anti-sigma-K factor RskA
MAEQQVSLELLGKREASRVELTADGGQDGQYASLLWAREEGAQKWVLLLYLNRFPSLSPDKAYQLWLIRDNQPHSAGVFQVDEDGNGAFVFESPEPIGEFDAIGITEEPAAGSLAPTSDPIAVGEVELG